MYTVNSQTLPISDALACPLPSEVVGPCGSAGNCLQSVTRTEYHLENCRCKPREMVTTRNCCCQQPSKEGQEEEEEAGTCLPEEHILLHRRVVYEWVGNHITSTSLNLPTFCPSISTPKVSLKDSNWWFYGMKLIGSKPLNISGTSDNYHELRIEANRCRSKWQWRDLASRETSIIFPEWIQPFIV